MIKVSTIGMVVSLKTDLRFPIPGLQGHGGRIIQDDTEAKIIKMIKENPQVSTADMAKELKIGIATVKRKIKKMSNVSYVGSGYSGHWEING